jgi:KDO2-lipid IV(A) lauroyltransferase
MNAEIEQYVRKWPAQYFWVHKRFKTRPEGERNFYGK